MPTEASLWCQRETALLQQLKTDKTRTVVPTVDCMFLTGFSCGLLQPSWSFIPCYGPFAPFGYDKKPLLVYKRWMHCDLWAPAGWVSPPKRIDRHSPAINTLTLDPRDWAVTLAGSWRHLAANTDLTAQLQEKDWKNEHPPHPQATVYGVSRGNPALNCFVGLAFEVNQYWSLPGGTRPAGAMLMSPDSAGIMIMRCLQPHWFFPAVSLPLGGKNRP